MPIGRPFLRIANYLEEGRIVAIEVPYKTYDGQNRYRTQWVKIIWLRTPMGIRTYAAEDLHTGELSRFDSTSIHTVLPASYTLKTQNSLLMTQDFIEQCYQDITDALSLETKTIVIDSWAPLLIHNGE